MERAGFEPLALVELDSACCKTLRANRPHWQVIEGDVYAAEWRLLNASDYGVSQLRPRVVIVALRKDLSAAMSWPQPASKPPLTVGELLHDQIDGQQGLDWRSAMGAAGR